MRYYELPGIRKKVSNLGLGTMIFHPDKRDLCFEILENFTENGGTFIDTAEVYGDPEEHGYSEHTLEIWLSEMRKREDIVLISKGCIPDTCKPIHPNGLKVTEEHAARAITGSLDRLKTDYLDIWLFHRDDPAYPVEKLVDGLNQEIEKGTIRAFGASNWSVKRIEEANHYAKANGLKGFCVSSPNFSLAQANEPYWPDTKFVTSEDKLWYEKNSFPLIAWSSLGRGFFAKGDRNYQDDKDLVRTFYSDDNFTRMERANELGRKKGMTHIEIALAYVLSQSFPVTALVGAANKTEMLSCVKAAGTVLTADEIAFLELRE